MGNTCLIIMKRAFRGVLTVNAATVTVTGTVIFSGGSLVLINGGNVVRG